MDDEAQARGRLRPGRKQAKRNGSPPPPKPIDDAGLRDLALHYAARYATTAAKLNAYLRRKLQVRPWVGAGSPDLDGIVGRLVELGYVNDAMWADAKRREMGGRGFGPRRVAQALLAAGVEDVAPENDAGANDSLTAAIRFAERKRLGPFARQPASDPGSKRRAMAAMLRAGHDFDVARRVLNAEDLQALEGMKVD